MELSKPASCKPSSLTDNTMHHFLQDYRVDGKTQPFNFTYMAYPFGSFMVPDDKRDAFYTAYTEVVGAGIFPPLTEKQGLAGPLVVDLDFKFRGDVQTRQYMPELMRTIVEKYFDVLSEYVQLDAKNNKCYVFERAAPYPVNKPGKPAVFKDGLHLMFPGIKCYERLKWVARDHIIKECKALFEELGTTNSVDDIVDRAVIGQNNWFVYLSAKPNLQPYKLTRILARSMDNALEDVDFKHNRKLMIELVRLLSVAGDVEAVSYIKDLPLTEPSTKLGHMAPVQHHAPARSVSQPDQECEHQQHEQVGFDLLQRAVMGLQSTRAAGYEDWFRVVCGIKNISDANNYRDDGRTLIHDFSQQSCENYDADEVDKKLSRFPIQDRGRGVGFGSIKHWLKEDNPDLHQQLFNNTDQLDATISSGGQHLDVADIFRSLFPMEFVWASTTTTTCFYRFTGTIWEPQDDNAPVINLLSQEVSKVFEHRAAAFKEKDDMEQDLAIKEQLNKKASLATKNSLKLRNMSYCNQVYSAISKRLHDADLVDQLDTNLDLLAFTDGVYDLQTSCFRQGRPVDMLSVCVPYDFPKHDPERREGLLTFLSQIKPQDEEREYMLDQLSQCLSGRIRKQLVHILAGPLAGNGKSTLFNLIAQAFGKQYFVTMTPTILTQKSAQANNANPIIVDARRARIVGMSEPEEGSRFNAALLKAMSGGDEQKARSLYSNKVICYRPQFRMFVLCNDAPDLDGKDKGLARRIRKITFSSQFTDIREPDLENHIYPINVDMDNNLPLWAPELMVLLLERFRPDYVYRCPASIQEGTNEYMSKNDLVGQWALYNLERNDAESFVTFKDLRELSWDCKEYGIRPKLAQFKTDLERVLGVVCRKEKRQDRKKIKNAYWGWKVKLHEDPSS